MNVQSNAERGAVLVASLMIVALLSTLLAGYYFVTSVELVTTQNAMNRSRGFYAAEAGLNLRAEAIRQKFLGYNRPAGTSPVVPPGSLPCQGDPGSGDFACATYLLRGRDVITYVTEAPGNPTHVVVPPGETFQNLNSMEYAYIVSSIAVNRDGEAEALLEMSFKSRVVPLFQFAAFYDKDLEITPGPPFTISGPVHTNGDLYCAANTTVDIFGDVTVASDLYRGRKEANVCWAGPFRVADPVVQRNLPDCSVTRRQILQAELAPWNGHIEIGVPELTVPQPDALDPLPGKAGWDNADLRILLDVANGNRIDAFSQNGNYHPANAQLANASCNGALATSNGFYNNREAKAIRMLDVDMTQLLNCVQANPALLDGKALSEDTQGGLVFYLGVKGPNDTTINPYGVRLRNGQELRSTLFGAPAIQGLTVISNQAAYVQGHYNSVNKKPAAVMADSMNVLSSAWSTVNDNASDDGLNGGSRDASPTTIHAAFLAGTDSTGGGDSETYWNAGAYSGGLHNFKRMHENWTNRTLTYRGSLVSLNMPLHVNGGLVVGTPQYNPPDRDFDYDTDFNDMDNLPPLTPQFVYLKMEVFVRDYGL